MNAKDYLAAMSAKAIPAGYSGLWHISKYRIKKDHTTYRNWKMITLPAGTYTYLRCITDATLYNNPPGDLVMEDTPFELSTHLGFAMKAYGHVLVTGLGLGCVVRGLLLNPKVEHITVIENSPDVLKLVQPYMPQTDRLRIIEADALEWTVQNTQPFTCAWHDLWVNHDEDPSHLDLWHARMIHTLSKRVKFQGAWAFKREMKELLIRKGFRWMG